MNIKETLKQIAKLEKFAIERAKELLAAQYLGYSFYVESVVYEQEKVIVKFCEETNHPEPDEKWCELLITDLEMNEKDWAVVVKKEFEKVAAVKLLTLEKEKQETLASKRKIFESLKKEFGE